MSTISTRLIAAIFIAMTLLWSAPSLADTAHATGDTHVDFSAPTANFGSNPNMFVATADKKSGERWVFVRFDLSTLSSVGEIDIAKLLMFPNQVQNPGDIHLHLVTEPWDEATVTAGSRRLCAPNFLVKSACAVA